MIRTPDQRLRVFVSSTLGELAEERRAVRRAIESLRLHPVMFELGARPHPPQDLYRAYLRQSDVFLGIYWERYGWIGPGMDISGLEDEYRLSGDKPRLIYVKRPAPEREARLESILEDMRSNGVHCYQEFSTLQELGELVMDDLALLLSERFEPASSAQADDKGAEDAPAGNLPVPAHPLIGREQELQAATALLLGEEPVLLTLVGPGGSGKTRLAFEIGHHLQAHFPDGVFVAKLESVADPALVLPTLARALGVAEGGSADLGGLLQHRLHDRRLLLIVDNFEQVAAAAPELSGIFETWPQARLLVTSRAPLMIRAERLLPIQPLQVPPATVGTDPADLLGYPAIRLFVDRSRDARSDFELTPENAPVVAEICGRLDGLPLALELAAARTKMFTPAMLLDRLQHRLETLSKGYADAPERQSTLRGTIDWSYHLLGESEQRLFRTLAVFNGGFSLEAAEQVGGSEAGGGGDVLLGLEALINNSLLQVAGETDGSVRLRLLETIREYADRLLTESGEVPAVRERHAGYYRALLTQGEGQPTGTNSLEWHRRAAAELDNLRAAMTYGLDTGDSDLTLDIATQLWLFWWEHGFWREGLSWLERGLACGPTQSPALRARALTRSGWLRQQLSDLTTALRLFEESIRMTRDIGDRAGTALALSNMGVTLVTLGQYDEAIQALAEALSIRRELDITSGVYATLLNLGIAQAEQGNGKPAMELFGESLALSRGQGDSGHVALVMLNMGEQYTNQGEYDKAEGCYREIDTMCEELERPVFAQYTARGRAYMALRRGDLDSASAFLLDTIVRFREIGDSEYALINLDWLGEIAWRQGLACRAAVLLSAAQSLRASLQVARQPRYEQAYREAVAACRDSLGAAEFSSAWARGEGMTLEDAVDYAVGHPGGVGA